MSEQPTAEARPSGGGGKKILGVPRTTFYLALGGAVIVGLAFYWWRNYQAGKQSAATTAASTTDTGNVDTSGQLSTIQTELETLLQEQGATATAGTGQTGGGGGWDSGGGSGDSGSGGSASGSGGSAGTGGPSGGPGGGHVVKVNNNDATIAWNANGATSWDTRIVGPGPINGHTGHTTVPQAVYSGLSAGHNYQVFVTPHYPNGTTGAPGIVHFVTTSGKK